jgi:MFS family permease
MGAAAEFLAVLTTGACIDRVGRRNTISAGLLACAVACFVCTCSCSAAAQAVWAAVGKFGCTGKAQLQPLSSLENDHTSLCIPHPA